GILYDPESLSDGGRSLLFAYATKHGIEVRTVQQVIEDVFYPVVQDLHGRCVGFNLPFDFSRLAIDHDSARGEMRGGFTLKLSEDKQFARIQVRHLNSRAALIRFALRGKQRTPRGMRKRKLFVPGLRGDFVDVRTIAAALLSGSWSLKKLGDHLDVEHKKLDADEHGGELTEEYLDYAV